MPEYDPLISIGMPVKNCQHTLELAVCSILWQTYENWELLILEDGSIDNTLEVISRFDDKRIRVFHDGKSLGLIQRLNQAIALSKGSLFARMDGDDISYPERFEKQVALLTKEPEIDLVGAYMIIFGKNGFPHGKRGFLVNHEDIVSKPINGFPMAHPTFMGRLEFFRRFLYDERAFRCEDQDLLLRSYRFSQFANVPDILLAYREEIIDLKKQLKGRWFLALALAREFRRQGKLGLASRAIFGQMLKASVDCVAVGSGLNYRLLRHRARSATLQERQKWLEIWRLVNQETANVQD
jgi:glycosyltransferase involved in cell wall biosynthesis